MEKYCLRLLLLHVPGATNFEHLLTVSTSANEVTTDVVHPTFRSAAVALGLLEDDQLRQTHADDLAADYLYRLEQQRSSNNIEERELTSEERNRAQQQALQDIADELMRVGRSLDDFADMPQLSTSLAEQRQHALHTIYRYENHDEDPAHLEHNVRQNIERMNHDQRAIYDAIVASCERNHDTNSLNAGNAFFIDGPGGTGKTFLYNALLDKVRSDGGIALATASSGIAATLLKGGRTAHSRFKIPIALSETTTCSLNIQNPEACVIRDAKLILWDEAPMTDKRALKAVDRLLRDIMGAADRNLEAIPFGGKTFVLGGSTHEELSRFSEYLPRVGEGREPTIASDAITLLNAWCTRENNLASIVNVAYENLSERYRDMQYITSRAILAPRNEDIDNINAQATEMMPGDPRVYLSIDNAENDGNETTLHPTEYLNTLNPSGLPPRKLVLKINQPIILLRNLNPAHGMCNGTRLICRRFRSNVIEAEIANGDHAHKYVFIPRIVLNTTNNNTYPFELRRRQFPVQPAFAMTINKAQDQSLSKVTVCLTKPVFSHGQLYVALSRVSCANDIKIILPKPLHDDGAAESAQNEKHRI